MDFQKYGIVYLIIALLVIVFVVTQLLPKDEIQSMFKLQLFSLPSPLPSSSEMPSPNPSSSNLKGFDALKK